MSKESEFMLKGEAVCAYCGTLVSFDNLLYQIGACTCSNCMNTVYLHPDKRKVEEKE